jgi:hypothetical protein
MSEASGPGRVNGFRWLKAESSGTANCLEVAPTPSGGIALRDSKDPGGQVLRIPRTAFDALIDGVKRGEFDDLLNP